MATDWMSIIGKAMGGAPQQCGTECFIEGADYFTHLKKSIEEAKGENSFIYIMGWMLDVKFSFNPNDKTDNLISWLEKASSERGVSIFALVWENPIYDKTNNTAIEEIQKLPGSTHAVFDKVHKSPSDKGRNGLKKIKGKIPFKSLATFGDGFFQRVFFSDSLPENIMPIKKLIRIKDVSAHHDKVVIINSDTGLKAYCGGMDINKNRISSQHDVQCCVDLSAAQDILKRFHRKWAAMKKMELHKAASKFNYSRAPEMHSISLAKERFVPGKSNYPYVKVIGTYNDPFSPRSKQGQERSAKNVILKAIENAKRSIYLEDQFMISHAVAKTLHEALLKGLPKLIILTQDPDKSKYDLMFPNRKRREFYHILRYGKVLKDEGRYKKSPIPDFSSKVRLYQVTRPAFEGSWAEIVHSKLYIIDDELMIVGSFNCSHRSLHNDSETGVVIFDTQKDTKSNFVSDFQEKLFRRYYVGPPKTIDQENTIMKDTLNWHINTAMISLLRFDGEDMDVFLNKLLWERLSIARGHLTNPNKFGDKIGLFLGPVFTLYHPLTDAVINEIGEAATYAGSEEFRELVWNLVEAK